MLYLIGVPGAGKTTLMQRALRGARFAILREPFMHVALAPFGGTALLGAWRRGGHGGTDALALDAQPKVERWIQSMPFQHIVAEGDRLANDRFFESTEKAGYNVTVAVLYCDEAEAARRRIARGSAQDANWIKGRRTKVERLRRKWASKDWTMSAAGSVAALSRKLLNHPAFAGIEGVEP